MKRLSILLLFLLNSLLNPLYSQLQSSEKHIVDKQELTGLIDSIATIVEHKYISEEMGIKMGNFIKAQEREGSYDRLTYEELGKKLTKDFLEVSNDDHMSAFYDLKKQLPQESILSTKLDKWGELSNYGYVENKLLPDNIGYLKIKHFTKWKFFEEAKEMVNVSLQLLQHTDALIIDVRDNPGGFEEIVAFLVSYFIEEESLLLQEYYCRYQDRSRSISTAESLPEKKLTDIPIFVLVNEGTGSAAESFAYILKHLNRATIIGQTTVGAGNGSNYFRVSNQFMVQVATWETINVVTQKSWEKVGVIPHIETTSEEALNKAMELAQIEGKKRRSKLIEKYEMILQEMDSTLLSYTPNMSDTLVINQIKKCYELGLVNEASVNRMGYEMLQKNKKSPIAEVIFKANTILHSHSANVYDSYAEALALNGKLKLAVENYQRAVNLGKKNKDPNLNLYIENLEKAQDKR